MLFTSLLQNYPQGKPAGSPGQCEAERHVFCPNVQNYPGLAATSGIVTRFLFVLLKNECKPWPKAVQTSN